MAHLATVSQHVRDLGHPDKRFAALRALMDLSNADGDEVTLVEDFSIIPPILSILRSGNTSSQVDALKIIANVTFVPENKVSLVQKYEAIPPLLNLLETSTDDDVIMYSCWSLSNIADNHHNQVPLMVRYNIVRPLLQVLKTTSHDGTKKQACKAIANSCLGRSNHCGLVRQHKIVPMMVSILQKAPQECVHWDNNGLFSWASTCIGRLSDDDDPLLREDIKSAGAVEVLLPFAGSPSYQGLKAVMTLAFLVGREEGGVNNVAQLNPQHTERLLDLLTNTLDKTGGEGYKYGVFHLPTVVRAVRAFTTSDTNTILLVEGNRAGALLWRVIHEYYCGGVGIEPAEVAVQCLVSVSLHLSRHAGQQQESTSSSEKLTFWWENCGGRPSRPCNRHSMLDALMKIREALDKTMPTDTLSHIDILLHDLGLSTQQSASSSTEGSVQTSSSSTDMFKYHSNSRHPPTSLTSQSPKHVLFSYAWNAQKEVVVEVCRLLRHQCGLDIWRDEEGSKVCPAQQGDMYQAMAAAVQLASCMVVFVSMAYTESANCRRELAFATDCNVPMIFVKLDENFRPSGSLAYCMAGKQWIHGCSRGRQASHVAIDVATAIHSLLSQNAPTNSAINQPPPPDAAATASSASSASSPTSPPHTISPFEATVPLGSLSVEEVCCVMQALHLDQLCEPIRSQGLKGQALTQIEREEDVRYLHSGLSSVVCRTLAQHVRNFKQHGVPMSMLHAS